MHELSIAMSIVDLAQEEADRRGGVQIKAVHLRLGLLSGVVKDALLSSYEMACDCLLYTSVVTFILEAGLRTDVLQAEIRAMGNAARAAGVRIVGGDTKVVEHGKADSMYITTTGLGAPLPEVEIDPRSVRPGDKVLLSGPIGDHGITILLARGELDMEGDLRSDTRSVFPLVNAVVQAAGTGVRWMRDPTRGGVATSLNELARDCGLGVVLFEDNIPVHDAVRGACELLGLDPLHIANEGQFLAVVAPELAEACLLYTSRCV